MGMRSPAFDEEAAFQARGELPLDENGQPISEDEFRARMAQRHADHDQAVGELLTEANNAIADTDKDTRKDFLEKVAEARKNGQTVVDMGDTKGSLGMGGQGASGAAADPENRVGIEDRTRKELWQGMGVKPAGQSPDVIRYGTEGPGTADFAEHPSAGFAGSDELAAQVAHQRLMSGVGTIGTEGPVAPLGFVPVDENGQPIEMVDGKPARPPARYKIDVSMNMGEEDGGNVTARFGQLDMTTGMGPARDLNTLDSPERPQQLTPSELATLKARGQYMAGDEALGITDPQEAQAKFGGKRVLGIGGGPTSEWAGEHALASGAADVEIAGAAPKPDRNSPFKGPLDDVQLQIRELVNSGQEVPPELTERQHEIMGQVVGEKQAKVADLQQQLDAPGTNPEQAAKLQQQIDQIKGELDPFRGSRVERNENTLNNDDITHVQADVIKVQPGAKEGDPVKVWYADGTCREVDHVIPSIGQDPNAPGGLNNLLSAMPPPDQMKLIPVIADGRVVGLQSDPGGITLSGAAITGTLGTNMPKQLLDHIPPEMRDAVISSFIDHANREDVSAGSRGIIPGIENVGQNSALMQKMMQLPPEERQAALEEFLRNR
jgi:hypothetical protein